MAFCSKVTASIRRWFKKVDAFLVANTETAISIVGKFKYYINNPIVDILTGIIPGQYDDAIKFAIRKAVDLSLDKLTVLSGCNTLTDPNEKLVCYANFLRGLPKDIRDAQLLKFASLVTKQLDGSRFSMKDYDLAVQATYTAN
ncbi:MAG: hypothetical protein J0I84_00030 [Terrimonas sp.]|nr:hypothetical protein [Terrimonas sp.]OJY90624.1 MAG: hypothetical protein BGP13_19560 [Sphingobacteriales bacterium 40-81]